MDERILLRSSVLENRNIPSEAIRLPAGERNPETLLRQLFREPPELSLADLTADVEGRTDEKRTDAQQYGAQQHHGCFPPGMFHTLFFLSVRNR